MSQWLFWVSKPILTMLQSLWSRFFLWFPISQVFFSKSSGIVPSVLITIGMHHFIFFSFYSVVSSDSQNHLDDKFFFSFLLISNTSALQAVWFQRILCIRFSWLNSCLLIYHSAVWLTFISCTIPNESPFHPLMSCLLLFFVQVFCIHLLCD